jgi:hypothetical protein
MTTLLLGTLLLSAAGPAPADWLIPALYRAAMHEAPAGTTRVEVGLHHETIPSGCAITGAELLGRLRGSGQAVFRLRGIDASSAVCGGWSWAALRIFGQAWVLTKDVTTGAPVANAVTSAERQVPLGHQFLASISADALAAQTLTSGTALEAYHVRVPGQIPGRSVQIELRTSDLVIATSGESVACQAGSVCARLPSGKRVSGDWVDGHLEVVLP